MEKMETDLQICHPFFSANKETGKIYEDIEIDSLTEKSNA